MRFILAAAGIAAMLLNNLFGCAWAQPGGVVQKAVDVPFSTIEKGINSGIQDRKLLVIKTAKEWRDLWQAHSSIRIPPPPLPSVDFDREMIVAVFSGEKRSGGYGIEIAKIEEDAAKGQLRVFFRETQPPPGSMTLQALTQPFDIVKTNKTVLAVAFLSERRPDGS